MKKFLVLPCSVHNGAGIGECTHYSVGIVHIIYMQYFLSTGGTRSRPSIYRVGKYHRCREVYLFNWDYSRGERGIILVLEGEVVMR